MLMEDLIQRISFLTQLEANAISVKVVEETVIRRVDRKLVNQDNPTIKNTLRDLKIIDNSAILVEMKDPAELEADASQDQEIKQLNIKGQDDEKIDIDSTENIRTVIVNMDSDKSTFDRYQINIDWTLQELTDFLLKERGL